MIDQCNGAVVVQEAVPADYSSVARGPFPVSAVSLWCPVVSQKRRTARCCSGVSAGGVALISAVAHAQRTTAARHLAVAAYHSKVARKLPHCPCAI
jgi:hypothetical protein